jgi:hypothetical protein
MKTGQNAPDLSAELEEISPSDQVAPPVESSQAESTKHGAVHLDLILSSTSLTRSINESANGYLKRLTHLHLQRKHIKQLDGLEVCKNLKVIKLLFWVC